MKTIEIAGTTIPIKFGMFVLGSFLRERNLKLSDLSLLSDDLLLALELAYSGVVAGFKQKGEACGYTLETFCDLVNKDVQGVNRIMEVISEELNAPQDDEKKVKGKAAK